MSNQVERTSTQAEADELNCGTLFIVYGDDPAETVRAAALDNPPPEMGETQCSQPM